MGGRRGKGDMQGAGGRKQRATNDNGQRQQEQAMKPGDKTIITEGAGAIVQNPSSTSTRPFSAAPTARPAGACMLHVASCD